MVVVGKACILSVGQELIDTVPYTVVTTDTDGIWGWAAACCW